MVSPKTSTLKTPIMVALLVILSSLGNLFFSLGMKRIGALNGLGVAALRTAFVAIFTSSWIWLGIVTMLLFLASMMLVLSWADFSYVLPASAAMYVLTPLLGHYVMGETVTGLRWAGVALICAGVVFVGSTPPSTVKRD
jgi:uncharacterized membrane protein